MGLIAETMDEEEEEKMIDAIDASPTRRVVKFYNVMLESRTGVVFPLDIGN